MRLANAAHYLDLGQVPEAIGELRVAETLAASDRDKMAVAESLGRAFVSLREWRQAQEHYGRGVELARKTRAKGPLVADLHAGLGLCLMKQSQFSMAAASAREGLTAGPSRELRMRMEEDLDKALLEEGLERGESPVSPEAPPARIRRIVVLGNRVELAYLRRRLPFKEGDALGPESLQKARESLFSMGLFKKVVVSSAPAGPGEADVSIFVRDGWYLIPFPFYTAGTGGNRGGAFISGRNIFRQNESFNIVGMGGKSGTRGMFGAQWEGWSTNLFFSRNESVLRNYDDGGASAGSESGAAPDAKDPAKFGQVRSEYTRRLAGAGFNVGIPIIRGRRALSGEVGWDFQQVGYTAIQGLAPKGAGHHSKAHVSLRTGPGGGGLGDLGAILGYGLADIEERLKPMARTRYDYNAGANLYGAAQATGSDFYFWYATLDAEVSATWGQRERAAFKVSAAHGGGLPEQQLLNTNDDGGLQGSYARTHRGRGIAGGSLSYSYPFLMSRLGMAQVAVFGEGALAWTYGRYQEKVGAGISVWYRFWRFPIPLGVGYTHSVDDMDGQISAAIGGRF
jgi:hypothetical protein